MGQLGQPGTTLYKVRRLNGRRVESGWESGRGEKDKQGPKGWVLFPEVGTYRTEGPTRNRFAPPFTWQEHMFIIVLFPMNAPGNEIVVFQRIFSLSTFQSFCNLPPTLVYERQTRTSTPQHKEKRT